MGKVKDYRDGFREWLGTRLPEVCPSTVCNAAKYDGVICADDSCDYETGVRIVPHEDCLNCRCQSDERCKP